MAQITSRNVSFGRCLCGRNETSAIRPGDVLLFAFEGPGSGPPILGIVRHHNTKHNTLVLIAENGYFWHMPVSSCHKALNLSPRVPIMQRPIRKGNKQVSLWDCLMHRLMKSLKGVEPDEVPHLFEAIICWRRDRRVNPVTGYGGEAIEE